MRLVGTSETDIISIAMWPRVIANITVTAEETAVLIGIVVGKGDWHELGG